MAQLTDDCFAFSGPLLPVDEVERIIRERVTPVAETETVALSVASARAEPWPAVMRSTTGSRVSALASRSAWRTA